ncbi:MAG: nickel pincer cofactor biosynthesis protein LarC, partial [Pirellulaceae bacterium]
MKTAYFDCLSGISGDMLLSALVDAGADRQAVLRGIESLGIPGIVLQWQPVQKYGFRALGMTLEHPADQVHRGLREIEPMVDRVDASPSAKDLAIRIFRRIAKAEAKVHGCAIEEVHFHEVGAIDSLVDILGSAIAWDSLGLRHAVSSPIPTGYGQIRIAHGVVSLPAPATAELLRGIPLASCPIPMDMTSQSGAAFLAELVSSFGPVPAFPIEAIGLGAGTRDLPDRPNVLRILIGDIPLESSRTQVLVGHTQIDDMTAEDLAFLMERIWHQGPLDLFTTPIAMKKGRPGILLTVLCRLHQQRAIEEAIFRDSTTLGVRWEVQDRTELPRQVQQVGTPWGMIRIKWRSLKGETSTWKLDFDECRAIAIDRGWDLQTTRRNLERYLSEHPPTAPREQPSSKAEGDHGHHDHGQHDHGHHD